MCIIIIIIISTFHSSAAIFSLLLGVDEEKRQIACGLVDTIGICQFFVRDLCVCVCVHNKRNLSLSFQAVIHLQRR